MTTTWHEDNDDVIAGRQIRNSFARLDHYAGRLVSERHGHRARPVAIND
jgi:hypothetical protein